MQTQEAIAMLRAIQGLGVSSNEIYSLTNLLDLPRMAAALQQQQQNNNG